jgi:AraC-like DNA-binding protein
MSSTFATMRKQLTLCIIAFLLLQQFIHAQSSLTTEKQARVDSLERMVPAASASTLPDLLADLALAYSWLDATRSVEYGRKALVALDQAALPDSTRYLKRVQYTRQIGIDQYRESMFDDLTRTIEQLDSLGAIGETRGYQASHNARLAAAMQQGNIWRKHKESIKAIERYAQGIVHATAIGDTEIVGHLWMLTAFAHEQNQDSVGCLKAYDKCLEAWRNDEALTAKAIYNRAENAFTRGNLTAASRDCEQAMEIGARLKLPYYVKMHLLKADILCQQDKPTEALAWIQRAESLAQGMNNAAQQRDIEDMWVTILEKIGRPNEAIIHLRKYNAIKDSLLSASHTEAVARMQGRLNVAKKDQEIAALRSENEKKNLRFWLFVTTAGMLAVAGWQWFRRYRRKKMQAEKVLVAENEALQARFDRLLHLHFTQNQTVASTEQVGEDEAFLAQLLKIMEDNLQNETFSVDDLPALMGVSRTVFFKRIKDVSGKTPATMLRSIRLEKARHLMVGTSLTVAEVGYSVGYKNTETFSRAFRDYFGQNPSDVRKSVQTG